MTVLYRGIPIINLLKVAGLNPDLSVNMGDPTNVAYIGPLQEDDDDEHMAEQMALVNYDGWIDRHGREDEMVLEQMTVDARRMLCDDRYMRMFTGSAPMRQTSTRPWRRPLASWSPMAAPRRKLKCCARSSRRSAKKRSRPRTRLIEFRIDHRRARKP